MPSVKCSDYNVLILNWEFVISFSHSTRRDPHTFAPRHSDCQSTHRLNVWNTFIYLGHKTHTAGGRLVIKPRWDATVHLLVSMIS